MISSKFNDTVVVLDLDDTLYPEIQYKKSGLSEVCHWIEQIYGIDCTNDIQRLLENNEPDILGALCLIVNLPLSTKESLLWIYRLHTPSIRLEKSTAMLLCDLKRKNKVAILTDGRSVTQRLKLKALGLTDLPVYISEEYESEKPSIFRFKLIMNDMPAKNYLYIGDNPQKDFIAPNVLGWTTCCLRDKGSNVHCQDVGILNERQRPKFWIDDLIEIVHFI